MNAWGRAVVNHGFRNKFEVLKKIVSCVRSTYDPEAFSDEAIRASLITTDRWFTHREIFQFSATDIAFWKDVINTMCTEL
jgi:hypothetical protein